MLHSARYVISEVSDKTFNPHFIPQTNINEYHIRKAARGIVAHNGKIALLHVTKCNYHKLPGGGIESGESMEDAFRREILEETGSECVLDGGSEQNSVTLETLDKLKLFQISYIFFAHVHGEPQDVHFTEKELAEGFELLWVPLNEAEELLKKDNPTTYHGKFINARDKAIMKFYKTSFH